MNDISPEKEEELNREGAQIEAECGVGPKHYDRGGNPIGLGTWVRLFQQHESYSRIALTEVCPGVQVSTVWLGIDHSFGVGPPVIFETMVFVDVEPTKVLGVTLDCEGTETYRWCTEAEAIAGHDQVVADLRAQLIQEG